MNTLIYVCLFGMITMSKASTTDCDSALLIEANARQNEDCPAGYHASFFGQTFQGCCACAAGSYMDHVNHQNRTCDECPIGRYSYNDAYVEQNNCGGACGNQGIFAECTACVAGRYTSAVESTACIACQQGYYSTEAWTEVECERCAAGRYASDANGNHPVSGADPGAVECRQCQAGRYSVDNHIGECEIASQGYIPNSNQTNQEPCTIGTYAADANGNNVSSAAVSCEDCPAGSSQPQESAHYCTLCTQGKYQSASGQASCETCTAGQFTTIDGFTAILSGATDCIPCLAGSYSGDHDPAYGYANCTLCPRGHYQNETGQFSCESCEAGSIGPSEGMSECTLCVPGRFTNATGDQSSECHLCNGGYVSAIYGAVECTFCSSGKFSNGPYGGTGENGQHDSGWGGSECADCLGGTYSAGANAHACIDCKVGKAQAVRGATECEACGSGEYTDTMGKSDCSTCPFWEYADGHENVDCDSCFDAGAGFGFAYPTQCVSSWLILVLLCIIPCILIYSYKMYMAGYCSRRGGSHGGTTTVILKQKPTATVQMHDLTSVDKTAC